MRCSLSTVPGRVQVPNYWVLGFWVIVIIVQVLGKYMNIGYLDPQGCSFSTIGDEVSLGFKAEGLVFLFASRVQGFGLRAAGCRLEVLP